MLIQINLACNHPSLVYKDYRIDSEAAEPRPAKNDDADEDADELASLLGQMGVSNGKKCQLCQTECVISVDAHPRSLLIFSYAASPLPTKITALIVRKLLQRPGANLLFVILTYHRTRRRFARYLKYFETLMSRARVLKKRSYFLSSPACWI